MDIESCDNPWDFGLARRVLQSFQYSEAPNEDSNDIDLEPSFDPKSSVPTALGDFNRLYQHLHLPPHPPVLPATTTFTISSPSGQSDPQSTSDSTAPENIPNGLAKETGAGKEVRWKDKASGGQSLSAETRRSLVASLIADDSDQGNSQGTQTKAPRRSKRLAAKAAASQSEDLPLKSGLIPASVNPKSSSAWPPPALSLGSPNPDTVFDKHAIQPRYILTPAEQEAKLRRKLQDLIPALPHTEPIHVFVDCSNIVIGFADKLKRDRGLQAKHSVRQPPISFESLAYILERGRRTDRRILVGSYNTSYIRGTNCHLPTYMKDAKKLRYEVNILEPVVKPRTKPRFKAKHGQGNGYATASGHSSDSDTKEKKWMGALARAEQGVDEILQMKMLESLMDSDEPATMVLASGDAAEAEYSGGFLKTVERALKKGWKVEVVAWKKGISYEYRSPAFTKRWKGQFRLIELDDFSEEMLAIYAAVFADADDPKGDDEFEEVL